MLNRVTGAPVDYREWHAEGGCTKQHQIATAVAEVAVKYIGRYSDTLDIEKRIVDEISIQLADEEAFFAKHGFNPQDDTGHPSLDCLPPKERAEGRDPIGAWAPSLLKFIQENPAFCVLAPNSCSRGDSTIRPDFAATVIPPEKLVPKETILSSRKWKDLPNPKKVEKLEKYYHMEVLCITEAAMQCIKEVAEKRAEHHSNSLESSSYRYRIFNRVKMVLGMTFVIVGLIAVGILFSNESTEDQGALPT